MSKNPHAVALMNTQTKTIEIRARAKAFSNEEVREHSFMVNLDNGDVRPWDEIAGFFTTVHSLTHKAIRRIRHLAEEQAKFAEVTRDDYKGEIQMTRFDRI